MNEFDLLIAGQRINIAPLKRKISHHDINVRKSRNRFIGAVKNAKRKNHVQRYFMQGHARINRNQPEID